MKTFEGNLVSKEIKVGIIAADSTSLLHPNY